MHVNKKNIAAYYHKMQVETASNRKQIAMMHQKTVLLVRDAIIGDKKARREKLDKAQNILSQLQAALKLDSDDEVIESLFLLYDYVYVQLEKDDVAGWRDALKVISVLSDTFNELLKRM